MSKDSSDPYVNEVYLTISRRLAAFRPAIYIKHYIGSGLVANRSTLDGIDFEVDVLDDLVCALRNAFDDRGNKAFVEGSKANPEHWDNQGDPTHWALRESFLKTHGIGFREIRWPRLSLRPPSLDDARPERIHSKLHTPMNADFNDSLEDRSSLHCAIAPDKCNIHIDQMGFVITGPDGEIIVDPDFGQHLINELWFKTDLDHKLPDYLIDHFSVIVPNSTNSFSRAGFSWEPIKKENYRVRVTGTCAVFGQFDCSLAVSLSGIHDFIGGR